MKNVLSLLTQVVSVIALAALITGCDGAPAAAGEEVQPASLGFSAEQLPASPAEGCACGGLCDGACGGSCGQAHQLGACQLPAADLASEGSTGCPFLDAHRELLRESGSAESFASGREEEPVYARYQ